MAAAKAKIQIRIEEPHAAQQAILDGEQRFNVVSCGRRFGKTRLALVRSLEPVLNGKPVAYFAPTYKMLKEFWREAVELYKPVITETSTSEHRFSVHGGGSFSMWSLDSADTVRGRKYALALIDEAAMVADLENAWNKVIRPTLTDYEGAADFYSTPKGLNFFYSLYTRGENEARKDWRSFHFPSTSNPFIKDAEVETARAELPEDVFRQEYLAEFIQGEGAVFRNITANLYAGGDRPTQHAGHDLVGGVDWGQVNDFTAISVGCVTCQREVELDRFNKIDWHFQRERLKVTIEKWGVRDCLVELNSIGSPNFDELVLQGFPVSGFHTTASSKPEIIQSLALALEKEEMKFLDDAAATRELEAYEAKRSATTGRISYNAAPGFHDDTVIARALMNRIRAEGAASFETGLPYA
jgi:hypothetical protein